MYFLGHRLQTSAKPKHLGQKYNFLTRESKEFAENHTVRIRASARDRFEGLRGHDYLKAHASEPKAPAFDIPVSHPSWLNK